LNRISVNRALPHFSLLLRRVGIRCENGLLLMPAARHKYQFTAAYMRYAVLVWTRQHKSAEWRWTIGGLCDVLCACFVLSRWRSMHLSD